MLTLYLDNNVYHHMQKGYGQAGRLRELLDRETGHSGVTVVMSMENLNELIPLVSADTQQFSEKIHLLRSVVDWDRPLKLLNSLLVGDIRSFVTYGKGAVPCKAGHLRKIRAQLLVHDGKGLWKLEIRADQEAEIRAT